MMVDLIGSGSPEPGVGPAAVVPGEVERQLVLECCQAERDDAQTPGAFALDRSDPALDHRQAPILPQRSETMPNPVVTTPAPESFLSELSTLVCDEVNGPRSR
jgi:hypothetical protein